MDDINKQIEIQNRISNLVKERQSQICDLKKFYDKKNESLYKDIILLNLNVFEEIFHNKTEYKLRLIINN